MADLLSWSQHVASWRREVHALYSDVRANPETPIPGQNNPRVTWMRTTFIELVVDGDVVDLNRIPLPPDTPIIDERFESARAANPPG